MEWARLFDRCRTAPPFLHPAWQLSWWLVFGSCEIHTIALRRGRHLTALAACFRYEERLVFIGNGISDQLDILAEDETAAEEIVDILSAYHLDYRRLREIPAASASSRTVFGLPRFGSVAAHAKNSAQERPNSPETA